MHLHNWTWRDTSQLPLIPHCLLFASRGYVNFLSYHREIQHLNPLSNYFTVLMSNTFFQDELYSVIVFASAEDDFCMARGSSAFSASSDQKPSLRGHCNSCYLVLLALSIHTPEEKQNSDVEQFT